ncbi:MAG TPA: hypothetical protein VF832_00495 [Longimicrobiales bacterium]
MPRSPRFVFLAALAMLALAACSPDSSTAPVSRTGLVAPRAQGGATDPLVVAPGLAGTWKGQLKMAVLPVGYQSWEFKVSMLTDTSFIALARVITPQTNGSSFTTSNITAYGKWVGSSVSMYVGYLNGANFTGTVSADLRTMSGQWIYGVNVAGMPQDTGFLSIAR